MSGLRGVRRLRGVSGLRGVGGMRGVRGLRRSGRVDIGEAERCWDKVSLIVNVCIKQY